MPTLDLEKTSFENLSDTVQIIIKDDNTEAVPMDLDALNAGKEDNQKEEAGRAQEEADGEE